MVQKIQKRIKNEWGFPASYVYYPCKLASEKSGKFMKHFKKIECMATFHTEGLKCLH
jgi:hypothetical protein